VELLVTGVTVDPVAVGVTLVYRDALHKSYAGLLCPAPDQVPVPHIDPEAGVLLPELLITEAVVAAVQGGVLTEMLLVVRLKGMVVFREAGPVARDQPVIRLVHREAPPTPVVFKRVVAVAVVRV